MLIKGHRPGTMTDYGAVRTKAVLPSLSSPCARHPHCGCQVVPCCFECPLPECSYVSNHRPATQRNYQKIRELRDQGMTSTEIHQKLGVSIRQVWRALSAC